MSVNKKYEWGGNWVSDNETIDLYEYEPITMFVDPNGGLRAVDLNYGNDWPIKGFFSYMKDFADFKVETIAK
jgi:hypothetical protein